jgi:uncharacterized protein YcbX
MLANPTEQRSHFRQSLTKDETQNQNRMLEGRKGVAASGKIPLAVVDRILNGTIAELEYNRWRSAFEEIARSLRECGTCPQGTSVQAGRNGGAPSRSYGGALTSTIC